jgi:hypothetical protein
MPQEPSQLSQSRIWPRTDDAALHFWALAAQDANAPDCFHVKLKKDCDVVHYDVRADGLAKILLSKTHWSRFGQ